MRIVLVSLLIIGFIFLASIRIGEAASTTDIQVFIKSGEFQNFHIINNACASKVNDSPFDNTDYSSAMYFACMSKAYEKMSQKEFQKAKGMYKHSQEG